MYALLTIAIMALSSEVDGTISKSATILLPNHGLVVCFSEMPKSLDPGLQQLTGLPNDCGPTELRRRLLSEIFSRSLVKCEEVTTERILRRNELPTSKSNFLWGRQYSETRWSPYSRNFTLAIDAKQFNTLPPDSLKDFNSNIGYSMEVLSDDTGLVCSVFNKACSNSLVLRRSSDGTVSCISMFIIATDDVQSLLKDDYQGDVSILKLNSSLKE